MKLMPLSRAAPLLLTACVSLAVCAPVQACGYHDPVSASVGMLNWAYPDALHVRTAVWMAQQSGLLARPEPVPAADPLSPSARFEQSVRLSETLGHLTALHGRLVAAAGGAASPAIAIVLIGPMLWARFDASNGAVPLVLHATGPSPYDVVIVTDEPVIAALTEGRFSVQDLQALGLIRAYGSAERVDRVWSLFDGLAREPAVHLSSTPTLEHP